MDRQSIEWRTVVIHVDYETGEQLSEKVFKEHYELIYEKAKTAVFNKTKHIYKGGRIKRQTEIKF